MKQGSNLIHYCGPLLALWGAVVPSKHGAVLHNTGRSGGLGLEQGQGDTHMDTDTDGHNQNMHHTTWIRF
jgi:hypothetical protein